MAAALPPSAADGDEPDTGRKHERVYRNLQRSTRAAAFFAPAVAAPAPSAAEGDDRDTGHKRYEVYRNLRMSTQAVAL